LARSRFASKVVSKRTGEILAMSAVLRHAFEHEWQAAMDARRAGRLHDAFRHLERAHVLGQRKTLLHVRGHLGMLALAWHRRDARELLGQVLRLLAALLFTALWVPEGNTGGTNVSAFRKMPIPEDLQEILDRDEQARHRERRSSRRRRFRP
jgi:hypothetical protein